MKRTLLAVVAGAALSVSAAVPAPDSPSHSAVQPELRPAASVHEPSLDLDPRSLPDRVLARTVGTGPTSDFLCGAAAGGRFRPHAERRRGDPGRTAGRRRHGLRHVLLSSATRRNQSVNQSTQTT